MKISLAIATYNEEKNIGDCIESCKGLAGEVIVVDGTSTDKTVEIAKSQGAKVILTSNPSMFHINKQKAIEEAKGEWVLQLDADERVTEELKEEIKKVIVMGERELEEYERNLTEKKLFDRHQALILFRHSDESRNPGVSGSRVGARDDEQKTWDDEKTLQDEKKINAFFIPRLNYFLGKYLRYGGVYPDGVIRLFKKGKAHLPCKDVHEVMEVDGQIGWLQNPLRHIDSPTFSRYLERNRRYIDLLAQELRNRHSDESRNPSISGSRVGARDDKQKIWNDIQLFFDYVLVKPISWFFMTTFRHKGILDGWQGVMFSFFSALRFPRAYFRYIK